jgi:DNA-binding XRE family transcriptional regulator
MTVVVDAKRAAKNDASLDRFLRQPPTGASPTKTNAAAPPPSSGSFVQFIGGVWAPLVGTAAVIAVAPSGLTGPSSSSALHYSPPAVIQEAVVDRRRRGRQDRQLFSEPQGSLAPSTERASDVAPAVAEEITAADHLFAIQNAFSLSVTQLAEVIGVSRGTVYTWMKGAVDLPRKDVTEARLYEVWALAKEWRRRCSETLGRLVEAPVSPARASLLDLLTKRTLDHAAIYEVLDVLALRLDAKAKERRRAAEIAPESIREITAENLELERLRLRGLGA